MTDCTIYCFITHLTLATVAVVWGWWLNELLWEALDG